MVFYSGSNVIGRTEVEFYPRFNDMPLGGTIEIYVYEFPRVEKMNNGTFVLMPVGDNVQAYFLWVLREDGELITIISKDNTFEISDQISGLKILESLEKMTDDITIIDPFDKRLLYEIEEAGGFKGGYIVKNETSNIPIWLK